MTKETVRKYLNQDRINFYAAVNTVVDYVKLKENKQQIVNYIVDTAVRTRDNSPITMLKNFISILAPVVQDTRLINTKYAVQMFLKKVWESSGFRNEVIEFLRNPVRKEVEEEIVPIPKPTKKDGPETPEQKKERLRRQAQLMTQAKKKKAAEKAAIELEKQKKVKLEQDQKFQKKEEKKLTKEQLEQLELLRNMRT